MAETAGLVQRLTVGSSVSCVWIGPNPNNTTLLVVSNNGAAADVAFAASLVQTLASAATNYRSVAAIHGTNSSTITALRVDPV
jgi:hypothetical protein